MKLKNPSTVMVVRIHQLNVAFYKCLKFEIQTEISDKFRRFLNSKFQKKGTGDSYKWVVLPWRSGYQSRVAFSASGCGRAPVQRAVDR